MSCDTPTGVSEVDPPSTAHTWESNRFVNRLPVPAASFLGRALEGRYRRPAQIALAT